MIDEVRLHLIEFEYQTIAIIQGVLIAVITDRTHIMAEVHLLRIEHDLVHRRRQGNVHVAQNHRKDPLIGIKVIHLPHEHRFITLDLLLYLRRGFFNQIFDYPLFFSIMVTQSILHF